MLFNESDIKKILSHVDLAIIKMVAKVLGKDFLTKSDLDFLKSKGVDLIKLVPKFPLHQQAFLFGRLSAALTDEAAAKITYTEFEKFVSKMGLFSPDTTEMSFYKVSANKTYSHIKNLGDKIKNDIKTTISQEEALVLYAEQASKKEEAIKKELMDGTISRRSVKKITSNIANRLSEWDRDWGRIVETESQDIFNIGRGLEMLNNDSDPEVYFDVFQGACKHCIRLYLTRGIGSQPRIFKMSYLLANGSNYGIKSKDWKPTIHPVHPHCRCNIRNLPKGYIWNPEKNQFEPPKVYERQVQRKGRAKINIGDREYIV